MPLLASSLYTVVQMANFASTRLFPLYGCPGGKFSKYMYPSIGLFSIYGHPAAKFSKYIYPSTGLFSLYGHPGSKICLLSPLSLYGHPGVKFSKYIYPSTHLFSVVVPLANFLSKSTCHSPLLFIWSSCW